MKTLEQLIIERAEEKQRAAEDYQRKQAEEAALVAHREIVVANLFQYWLGKEYSFDASDLDVMATWNGARQYYTISIETPDDGRIDFSNPVNVYPFNIFQPDDFGNQGLKIDVVPTNNSSPWQATIPSRGERLYVDYADFIDAYIYCLFGTANPTLEDLQALHAQTIDPEVEEAEAHHLAQYEGLDSPMALRARENTNYEDIPF